MNTIETVWLKHWLTLTTFCLVLCGRGAFAQDAAVQDTASPKNITTAVSTEESTSPGVSQNPGQEQSVLHYAGLTLQQVEQFLLNAKVVRLKNLSVGVTESRRATLDDGKLQHDAHVQTVDISKSVFQTDRGTEFNFRDSYKFNIAAYELDKLLDLNMVPPSVERKVEGSMAAVTWWIDDALMELNRLKKKIHPPDPTRFNQQNSMRQVFDELIYNTDDNQGNILYSKDWKTWLIDHTRAFRGMKTLQNPKNLGKCDRHLLAKMRELNKDVLQQKLEPFVTKAQIEGLLARRDIIVKFFDDQVAQKGETAVLFDFSDQPKP
jgi:hypothetical protein